MSTEQGHVLLPSVEHLELLDVLSIMVLLIHLPYIGMVLGSTLSSLVLSLLERAQPNPMVRRLSHDLVRLFSGRLGVLLVLGFLPLVALMLIDSQIFYGAPLSLLDYYAFMIVAAAVGLLLIYIYQLLFESRRARSAFHLGVGALGLLSLLGAFFVFVSTTAILLSPEHWPLIRTPVPLVFSANVVARFLLFLSASLALTGVGVLFFCFVWSALKPLEGDYRRFVRNFGAGTALAFLLLSPLLLLWNIVTMPMMSYSPGISILYALALLGMLLIGWRMYRVLVGSSERGAGYAFGVFLVVMLLLTVGDQLGRANANREQRRLVIAEAEQHRLEMEDLRGLHAGAVADVRTGEKIFKTRCAVCHDFNKRVVGPPYRETLPQYVGDEEALKAFIKSPTKKNPDYPPMPAPGLRSSEIDSVVLYLMKQLAEEGAE